MQTSILTRATEALHGRGRVMLGVAATALAPALTATVVGEALTARAGVIVNGRLEPETPFATLDVSAPGAFMLSVPLLLALGSLTAAVVGLRVLNGDSPRDAWRYAARRAGAWLGLAALLLGATVLVLFGGATVTAGGTPLVAVFLAWLFALCLLALALPVLAIEQRNIIDALRRAVALVRRDWLRIGFGVLLLGLVGPTAVQAVLPTWPLLDDLVLIALTPWLTAVLLAAYRFAVGLPVIYDAPQRTSVRRRLAGSLGVLAIAAVPSLAAIAVAAANPRNLPEVSATHPQFGYNSIDHFAVLAGGTLATVESMQIRVCRDGGCEQSTDVHWPCRDGGRPQPVGGQTRSCDTELHDDAVLTADGTLVAIGRGADGGARLWWCRTEPDEDGLCTWGGARTILDTPATWWSNGSAVVATPGGGFAAALTAPGPEEARNELVLVSCDRLDCPTPTVHSVQTVYPSSGIAIDVDRTSGRVVFAYYDGVAGELLLGTCGATCATATVETMLFGNLEAFAGLRIVATAVGQTAVVMLGDAAVVVDCNPRCARLPTAYVTAWPLVDRAGRPFIVGDLLGGTAPVLANLREGSTATLPWAAGVVVAAVFGADGRLRVVYRGSDEPTLATYG